MKKLKPIKKKVRGQTFPAIAAKPKKELDKFEYEEEKTIPKLKKRSGVDPLTYSSEWKTKAPSKEELDKYKDEDEEEEEDDEDDDDDDEEPSDEEIEEAHINEKIEPIQKMTEQETIKERFSLVEVPVQTTILIRDNKTGENFNEMQILLNILNLLENIKKSLG